MLKPSTMASLGDGLQYSIILSIQYRQMEGCNICYQALLTTRFQIRAATSSPTQFDRTPTMNGCTPQEAQLRQSVSGSILSRLVSGTFCDLSLILLKVRKANGASGASLNSNHTFALLGIYNRYPSNHSLACSGRPQPLGDDAILCVLSPPAPSLLRLWPNGELGQRVASYCARRVGLETPAISIGGHRIEITRRVLFHSS